MTKEECEIETSKAIMEMRNHIAELEKEIAELEKENKELKTVKIPQLERKIASIRGAHSVDCKKLNARAEQVERLKKENAELKEYNKYLRRKRQGGIQKQYNKVAIIKQQDGQLTKAKEILRGLYFIIQSRINYENNTEIEDEMWRAKQLLNEVEK